MSSGDLWITAEMIKELEDIALLSPPSTAPSVPLWGELQGLGKYVPTKGWDTGKSIGTHKNLLNVVQACSMNQTMATSIYRIFT